MAARYTLSLEFTDYMLSVRRKDIKQKLTECLRNIIQDCPEEACAHFTLEDRTVGLIQSVREDCFYSLCRTLFDSVAMAETLENRHRLSHLHVLVLCYKHRMSYDKLCKEACFNSHSIEDDLSDVVSTLNTHPEVVSGIQKQFPNAPRRVIGNRFTVFRLVKFICEWADNVAKSIKYN